MVSQNVTVPFVSGYDLGLGVDALTLDAKDHVVDGPATPPTGGGGSDSTFTMRRVTSTDEVMQDLGVDVSVSVGSVLFGAGAADSFSFAKKQQVQSSSLCMTVTAWISLPALSIDSPTLSSDAQQDQGTASVFHDRFGDTFIKTVTRGGRFVGVLKIDTRSETDADQIANQLKGSYEIFSGDVGVKINSTTSNYDCTVEVDLWSIGGPIFQKPTDPDGLITCLNAFLDAFRTNPEANAQIFEATLAPVQDALGPLPPNSVDIANALDILQFCAKYQLTTLDNLNFITDCVQHPDRYVFAPPIFRSPTPKNSSTGCNRISRSSRHAPAQQ